MLFERRRRGSLFKVIKNVNPFISNNNNVNSLVSYNDEGEMISLVPLVLGEIWLFLSEDKSKSQSKFLVNGEIVNIGSYNISSYFVKVKR